MDPVITKAAADAAVAVSKEAYEDIVHPAATNIGKTGGLWHTTITRNFRTWL